MKQPKPMSRTQRKAHKARQRRLNNWMPQFAAHTANKGRLFR